MRKIIGAKKIILIQIVALAYDLADSQGIWTLKHHTEWGAFKADQHCDIFNDNRSPVHLKSSGLEIRMNESVHNCCGEFPRTVFYEKTFETKFKTHFKQNLTLKNTIILLQNAFSKVGTAKIDQHRFYLFSERF